MLYIHVPQHVQIVAIDAIHMRDASAEFLTKQSRHHPQLKQRQRRVQCHQRNTWSRLIQPLAPIMDQTIPCLFCWKFRCCQLNEQFGAITIGSTARKFATLALNTLSGVTYLHVTFSTLSPTHQHYFENGKHMIKIDCIVPLSQKSRKGICHWMVDSTVVDDKEPQLRQA